MYTLKAHANGRNKSQHCCVLLGFFLANNVASVCMGLKVWPVSNYTQQVPTLLWFHVIGRKHVGPVYMGLYIMIFKKTFGAVPLDLNSRSKTTQSRSKTHSTMNDENKYKSNDNLFIYFQTFVLILSYLSGTCTFCFADISGRNFISSFGHFWAELFFQVGGGGGACAPSAPPPPLRTRLKSLQWNLWLLTALCSLLSWTTLQTFSQQRSVNGSSWTANKRMLKVKYPCPINLKNACQFTLANFIKCSTQNICKRFNNKQKLRHVLTQERLLAKHTLLVPV